MTDAIIQTLDTPDGPFTVLEDSEGRVLASVLTGQEGVATELRCRLGRVDTGGSAGQVVDKAAAQLAITGTSGRTSCQARRKEMATTRMVMAISTSLSVKPFTSGGAALRRASP